MAPWLTSTVQPWLTVTVFHHNWPFNSQIGPHSILLASAVLAVMIIPTITAISRDVLAAVPEEVVEGGLAVGATRGQVLRRVALPTAGTGILGGITLGAARALGETIAVYLLIGGLDPESSVSPRPQRRGCHDRDRDHQQRRPALGQHPAIDHLLPRGDAHGDRRVHQPGGPPHRAAQLPTAAAMTSAVLELASTSRSGASSSSRRPSATTSARPATRGRSSGRRPSGS